MGIRGKSPRQIQPPAKRRDQGITRKLMQVDPALRQPDDLDRYRNYAIYGKKLPPNMEAKFLLMRVAFNLFAEGYTQRYVIEFLGKEHGVGERDCWRIIADAKGVFGDIMTHNKAGERVILAHRYDKLYDEVDDQALKVEILKQKAKLLGLLDKEAETQIDITQLNLYPTLIFTSDPSALQEPEDTPYEDLTDEAE